MQGVDIYFQKPDKTIIERAGTIFNAAGGVVEYISDAADFDQVGRWKTQVVVRFSNSNIKHSDIGTITVVGNLT